MSFNRTIAIKKSKGKRKRFPLRQTLLDLEFLLAETTMAPGMRLSSNVRFSISRGFSKAFIFDYL